MLEHASAPVGWYAVGDGTVRYWDGEQWGEPTVPQTPAAAAAPAPAKRKHTLLWWLLGIFVGFLCLILLLVTLLFGGVPGGVIVDHGAGDLASDLDMGERRDLGHENVALPIIVTNTTDTVADYRMEVYGIDEHGKQLTENWITFDRVAPGQTARADLLLLPSWTYAFRNAQRAASPAGAQGDPPSTIPLAQPADPVAMDEAKLGAPRDLGYGNTAIPVTVTNDKAIPYDYRVTFTNSAPHQAVNAEWASGDNFGEDWSVAFSDVAPGESVTAEAVLTVTDPRPDSLSIVSVERRAPTAE